VPQLTLHVHGALPLLEEQARETVPKAMRREVRRQRGPLEHGRERTRNLPLAQGCALGGGEDPRGRLRLPAPEPLGLPLDLKAQQGAREVLAHVDGAPVPILRHVEAVIGKGALDAQRAPGQVHIGPLEAPDLSRAQARAGQAEEEGIVGALMGAGARAGRVEKGAELLARQGPDTVGP
jgi:hypothetical protein